MSSRPGRISMADDSDTSAKGPPRKSRGWFVYQHARGSGWVVRYRIGPNRWRDHRVPSPARGGPAIPATLDENPRATEAEKAAALKAARTAVEAYARKLLARRREL